MAITALPTPPSRQDPTTFNDRADAFLGALPQFQTEANALQVDVNAKQVTASAAAVSASTSATNALASENAAAATSNVVKWVSGTTYANGANVFSPITYYTYRRITASGSGTTDPSADFTNWVQISGELPGMIKMWPTATAPAMHLLCNGQAVSRTTYAALFAVIGTTFGAGNGSTTFNLPNYNDRMPIGAGSTYALNAQGGSKDAIAVEHTHTFSASTDVHTGHQHYNNNLGTSTNGSHTHTLNSHATLRSSDCCSYSFPQPNGSANSTQMSAISTAGDHNHTVSGWSDINGAHSHSLSGTTATAGSAGTNANLPPYIGIYFIIKV